MFSPCRSALPPVSPAQTIPCPRFPVALSFPDVEADVLAHEAASELRRAGRPDADAWRAYLGRVLPALERNSAREVAQALLAAGTGEPASRSHAERMRRQAIAAGSVHRARFWADVAEEIGRARPS
jgi:hypothetical protein